MTIYDEYRKQYPINPEPSEFRDIIESEIKRVIAWMTAPPWPASVADWTEADYEVAKELMAPIFDMIVEYESLHYPIAEPSKAEPVIEEAKAAAAGVQDASGLQEKEERGS